MLKVLTEQVDVSRSRLIVAQTAYDTGSESELELLKARVDLIADSTALMRQRAGVTTAMSVLNVLLARDASVPFAVDEEITIGSMLQEDVLRRDLARNSQVLLAQRMRDVDSLDIGRNTARLWPTLQFKAGYNYSLNETDAAAVNYTKYYGPNIGLSASFPLFNGFVDQHARENAIINAASGDLRLRETRLQTNKRFLTLWNEYITERSNVELERGNVEVARKSLSVAQEAYAVGSSSSLELREVQRNLLSAEQRLVDAQYAVMEREVGLKLLTGSVDAWN
jgi:outer membrane protein TolC